MTSNSTLRISIWQLDLNHFVVHVVPLQEGFREAIRRDAEAPRHAATTQSSKPTQLAETKQVEQGWPFLKFLVGLLARLCVFCAWVL